MRVGSKVFLVVAGVSAVDISARPSATSQPSTVVVTVVDSLSRYPLANTDVFDIATGHHRFTDETGTVRLVWPSDGQLQLRIRQVGYQPLQRTLRLTPGRDAVTFAMSKVAFVISTVKAVSHCSTPADSSALDLSVALLDQLKQGAEKYIQFRQTYPFEATIERRTAAIPANGDVKRILVSKEKFSSDSWEPRYKPGEIIEWSYGNFTVPILFLSTLADSVFWEHHCFVARGVEWYQGARVVRLEFSPSNDVKGPDYFGSARLDSASSLLLRIDFQLANAKVDNGPRKLEGYTTFTSPSPFVMVPDTTVAVWWLRDAEHGDWGKPEFAQSLHVEDLRYRKQKPPVYPATDSATAKK